MRQDPAEPHICATELSEAACGRATRGRGWRTATRRLLGDLLRSATGRDGLQAWEPERQEPIERARPLPVSDRVRLRPLDGGERS